MNNVGVQFLSPWTALLTAAVALPLLLLLYFLKLRRQSLRIPSTLLWRASIEDLQVNVPFQRLRWSLLLLLQLLMLLALIAALAEPLWRGEGRGSPRVVLLIDRSASMNAPISAVADENAGSMNISRFEAAREAARAIIDTVGERGGPSHVMLIAFAARAQVVSGFESNRGVLSDALDAITATDEQSDLEAALDLASAFTSSGDEQADAAPPPRVVLLSDGNVVSRADASRSRFTLRGGEFEFVQVAEQSASSAPDPGVTSVFDNLGIVSLGARRDYDDPARVVAFIRLLNAGDTPLEPVLTIAVDGSPAATLRANVPAAAGDIVGETSVSHALDLPVGAVITVRHNHADALPADDLAAVVLPPPQALRIAMVIPDGEQPDPYLHELLQALEPRSLQTFPAATWATLDPESIDSGTRFDLVVFDRVSGHRLPGVPSMTFGGVPSGVAENPAPPDLGGQSILSWDRQHPVMRSLSLDTIAFNGFGSLEGPESLITPLAWSAQGPIIAVIRTRGARHVVSGFALRKSNWPLHVSSAMFLQNAAEFLTLASGGTGASGVAHTGSTAGGDASGSAVGGGAGGLVYRPGDVVTVRAAPNVDEIVVEGAGTSFAIPIAPRASDADSISATAPAGASTAPVLSTALASARLVTLPALSRAGLYRVRGAQPPSDLLAVSMLSEMESDLQPRDSITVNAQASEARISEQQRPLPLWPWLLGAALALAIVEWLVYCRRVA